MADQLNLMNVLGPICSMLLTVFSKSVACPNSCQCQESNTAVTCRGVNINAFPTGFPSETKILRIISTNLKEIPADALIKMVNLEKISILDNKQLTTLPPGLFDNLYKLRRITINYNNMALVPANVFKNLPNLETLLLRKNKIVNVPGTAFRNLSKLTHINLENNEIRSLPGELFDHTVPNISFLFLNGNHLSSFPDGFFRSISKRLRTLLLASNHFKTMPVKALKIIENLKEITVDGNQLNCNCSLKGFADWAKNLSLEPSISCRNGGERSLSKINLTNCEEKTTLSPTTTRSTTSTSKTSTAFQTNVTAQSPKTSPSQTTSTKSAILKTVPPETTVSETTPSETSPRGTREPNNGGPERRDSRENDGKRKTVIISVSLSLAATVIVVALISYLFHTGIIPISWTKFQSNKMIIYDAEGNVLVKNGQAVSPNRVV